MKTPIVIALAMVAAGCGSLTETSASQILASNLITPSNAPLLANSVVADFECAYADFATASGIVSDELADAQLSQIGWDYDRRTLTANSPITDDTCAPISNNPGSQQVPGVWAPLSTARADGDNLLGLLNGWTVAQVPTRVKLIGKTAAYTGYALTLMGETMCAGAIDGGPRITPDSLLGLADARFSIAITNATAAHDDSSLAMAYLGRARERLDRGHAAAARTDAANVPSGFVRVATYDAGSTRRENRLYTVMFRDYFYSVQSPFWRFMYDTAAATIDTVKNGNTVVAIDTVRHGVSDPRVAVDSSGIKGADNATIIWQAQKYPTIGTSISIAHSSEAQLIIAEADLAAGNTAGAINIIDSLHKAVNLPPYTRSTSPDTVRTAIINERAAELFLEGHRLGDMIRYKLPLNPPAGTPFKDGGFYGTQLCFPLPVIENGK